MHKFKYEFLEPFVNHMGEKISLIEARPINLADFITYREETEGLTDDAASKVLFSKISGHSLETFGKISYCDWMLLKVALWAFLKGYDKEYEPEIIEDDSSFLFMLEKPIERDGKPAIDSITLRKMTLDDHIKSQTLGVEDFSSDAYKSKLYAHLSQIPLSEITKMGLPDYLRLEVYSSDFLLGKGTMQRILERLPSFTQGIQVPA